MPSQPSRNRVADGLFAAVLGLIIGLAFLKFGNPVILEKQIGKPENWIDPWPFSMAYPLLLPLVAVSLFGFRKSKSFNPIIWILIGWFGWQVLAATSSVSAELSQATLKHFAACVLFFLIGYYRLTQTKPSLLFWGFFFLAFLIVLRVGFDQHFGGLEQTRNYFKLYILPTLENPPPELIKKMETNRVFSTLFYPNTFAGLILMCLPLAVYICLFELQMVKKPIRLVLLGVVTLGSLACLFWTGSKSGWLVLMLVTAVMILRLPGHGTKKVWLCSAIIVIGTGGFLLKYEKFIKKGATSVVARFDYWSAALQNTKVNPLLGSGPGTFGKVYPKLKKPESEMARLCHNDYLEQATDSGIPGFLLYIAFIGGCMRCLYRYSSSILSFQFWLFASLLGVALQGLSEVSLYIPAIAWPYFLFLGYALQEPADSPESTIFAKKPMVSA
jgi:O-antigen ligase